MPLTVESIVPEIAPVLVRNMDGTILYWSRGMENLFGRTRAEVSVRDYLPWLQTLGSRRSPDRARGIDRRSPLLKSRMQQHDYDDDSMDDSLYCHFPLSGDARYWLILYVILRRVKSLPPLPWLRHCTFRDILSSSALGQETGANIRMP